MTVLLSFFYFYFFFNDTATTEIYTLSLHDALPIYSPIWSCSRWGLPCRRRYRNRGALLPHRFTLTAASKRSEEHTSELQSQSNLVCRLLLEKKNQKKFNEIQSNIHNKVFLSITFHH